MASNTSNNYKEIDPIAIDLKTVADHFDREDEDVRELQVRYWKKLKYYWNNFSLIFWSGRDGDYKLLGQDDSNDSGNGQAYYDRPVNVFKAFLETIIAALSIQIPSVTCVPDDADNPLDISTAKAGNIISKLIYNHNNVVLLWLQSLYIYCTEGLIACYSYTHSSEEYGTYKKKKYKDEEVEGYYCPNCEIELDEEMIVQSKIIEQSQKEKFDPNENDSELDSLNSEERSLNNLEPLVCPSCSLQIDSNLQKSKLTIKRLDGYTSQPKSRICLDIYGGLYVKVPLYAKKQSDMPYLRLAYETSYVNALEEFKELRDKLPQGGWSNMGINNPYEQYARLSVQYRNQYPKDLVTVRQFWLRPSSFNILDDDKYEKLSRKYPNGVKVILVNDIVAKYCAENLDDHWTLTHNPMSDYLVHQPLGELLVNIQDIVNDLISLVIQTIEHGIPMTWVDPALVNVNQYGQVEASPGNIAPVKQTSGNKNISEGFHSTVTSSLPPETLSFFKIIQELGQFVSGALPSIFGGAMPGSGDTASEYKMSQSMALQRLNTPWKMLNTWWKTIMMKVIPQYMKLLQEDENDERFVEKDQMGNYVNTFIKKAEILGKIGNIELDNSDQLPVTEEQQKQIIMELMALNNMEIFGALSSPENLPFVRKIVRIPQFKLPGEADRQKQLEEIKELLLTTPIPVGPFEELPFVEIDPILDNHQVEADTLRSWMISEEGRLTKKENPEGYKNCMLHYEQHINAINKAMRMSQMMGGSQNPGNEKQNNSQNPKKKVEKEKANVIQ